MRDQITNAALAGISNPYQITANLVALEKELQLLKGSYQGTNIHSVFFFEAYKPRITWAFPHRFYSEWIR